MTRRGDLNFYEKKITKTKVVFVLRYFTSFKIFCKISFVVQTFSMLCHIETEWAAAGLQAEYGARIRKRLRNPESVPRNHKPM